MTRPIWLTDEILGYITGLMDGANIWNTGHLPGDFLYAMLMWRFSMSAEATTEAIRIWNETPSSRPPEVDEEGA